MYMEQKIIQISVDNGEIYALDSNGRIFHKPKQTVKMLSFNEFKYTEYPWEEIENPHQQILNHPKHTA